MPQEYCQINVIEVPINSGQPKLGVSEGSHRIWEDLKPALQAADMKVFHECIDDLVITEDDVTETVIPGAQANVKNLIINGEANRRISEQVRSHLGDDRLTLTLGGDHSLALGTVHGQAEFLYQQEKEIAVLWIDAHADLNVPKHSGSGNLHGMPLGFVTDGSNQTYQPNRLAGHTWIKDPRVKPHNLAYVGLRDLDHFEVEVLEQDNILAFTMDDVRRLGIDDVMRRVYDHLQVGPEKKLHLSVDIDSMDPSLAPSTGTPVPGGLSLDEGLHIMEQVHRKGHVQLVDLVEVNPTLGNDDDAAITVGLASTLLQVVCGVKNSDEAREDFLNKFTPRDYQRQTQ